jgi:cation transport regulator ChaC
MTIYVFGYGSLINMKKNKHQIENPVVRKICPVVVKDLKRYFNVLGNGNDRLLGVKDMPNSVCNGIIYRVSEAELERLIAREKHYTPKILERQRIMFSYNKTIPFTPADEIICFYPQAKVYFNKKNGSNTPDSRKLFPDVYRRRQKNQ